MAEDATIAHEFYKIRKKWESIAERKWDMAIWVIEYPDMDIIDKFMEIEASPIGVFPDIFFRFTTLYTSDKAFEENIWAEFLTWFNQGEDHSLDMIYALKKDGYLPEDYDVNRSLPPTFQSVLEELLRLKSMLPLEEENFIIYIAPGMHETGFDKWFSKLLDQGLPEKIRLATIDFEQKRAYQKLRKHPRAQIEELTIALDMGAAMSNAMDQDSDADRPQAFSSKFQKQVRKVMTATLDEESSFHDEVDTLILYGKQMKMMTAETTAHLTAAIAYANHKDHKEALEQSTLAVEVAEPELFNGDEAYPLWRSAMFIKATMLMAYKKNDEAVQSFQDLADVAIKKGDSFYVMEAYRMIGFVESERGRKEDAWNANIFALQAGSNLPEEVRKSSTFVYVAASTYKLAIDIPKSQKEIILLEDQYEKTIGAQWQQLLLDSNSIDSTYFANQFTLKS